MTRQSYAANGYRTMDQATSSAKTVGKVETLPRRNRAAPRTGPSALGRWLNVLFYLVIIAALYDGWHNRNDQLLTAESGAGYILGIVGGSMMLSMFFYSLRKRARFMRRMLPIRYWFQTHMTLGVLGPTLILYHANFRLGSLNSRVALLCMLVVAGSGLVGRFIYTRIHVGLYGKKASLESLRLDADRIKEVFSTELPFAPALVARLEAYEQMVQTPPAGVLGGALRHLTLGIRTRVTYLALRRLVRRLSAAEGRARGWRRHQRRAVCRQVCRHVGLHLATVRKVSELSFYERLFSLWHLLHVPLFIMMVISAVVHVIAVHMY